MEQKQHLLKKNEFNAYFKKRQKIINDLSGLLVKDIESQVVSKIEELLEEVVYYNDKARSLEQLEEIEEIVSRIIESHVNKNLKILEESMFKSFQYGAEFADAHLSDIGFEIQDEFHMRPHRDAIIIALNNTYKDILQRTKYMDEFTKDIIRNFVREEVDIILRTGQGFHTSTKELTKKIQKEGLVIVDNAGKTWKEKTYSEMVIQTKMMNTFRQGTTRRLWDHNLPYVMVSSHGNPCPKCANFQGLVYFNGRGGEPNPLGAPHLTEAIAGGLLHPRCRHTYTAYVVEFYEPETTEKIIQDSLQAVKEHSPAKGTENTLKYWKEALQQI